MTTATSYGDSVKKVAYSEWNRLFRVTAAGLLA